ncbi:hypothetical protein MASR1M45_15070 [Candidatus Kapaibacterium sp.]
MGNDSININLNIIQYISIAGSLVILLLVVELVRRKKIKEQYSLLWLFFSLIFLVFSIWREALDLLAVTIGIAYPPAAFLLILVMAIYLILIQYSIIISKLSNNLKESIQEISLLKHEIDNLKNKVHNENV